MVSTQTAKPIELADLLAEPCRIVAFPSGSAELRLKRVHRFSMRDRITAHEWSKSAEILGYSKVLFELADEGHDIEAGEFLSIYAAGEPWASWGIGCVPTGMMLWHSARGTTIGQFDTLRDALAQIGPVRPR